LTRVNVADDIDAKKDDEDTVDVDTKEAREKYYYHPRRGFVKVSVALFFLSH
jgi:hypothetical protein